MKVIKIYLPNNNIKMSLMRRIMNIILILPKHKNNLIRIMMMVVNIIRWVLCIKVYLKLIRKRVSRYAALQTVGNLIIAPEIGANNTDRWKSIDIPYMECALMCSSNPMAIIDKDIRNNPSPRWVAATWSTDKNLE